MIVGGIPLYLRVRDLNKDPNATNLDTIYVDSHLCAPLHYDP